MTVQNLPARRGGNAVAVPSAAKPAAVRRVSLASVLLQLAAIAAIAFIAFAVVGYANA